jgi:hypothetical protein
MGHPVLLALYVRLRFTALKNNRGITILYVVILVYFKHGEKTLFPSIQFDYIFVASGYVNIFSHQFYPITL